ncbi:fasciclin domain-containing protein [Flavobacteriaceae bacterium]|nr:fasciclin domain-containing protein [Flavobacteriaceae bacterium]
MTQTSSSNFNGTYSEIVATDVMGSNGVIHVIDTVVMPE